MNRNHIGAKALSAAEHLWLHGKMERRAHELWLAHGCPRAAALKNWLQAERETWDGFKRIPPGGQGAKTTNRGTKLL